MAKKIQTSKVFNDLTQSIQPVKVLEGGSRSSKTWSIILWLLTYYLYNQRDKRVTIVREALTWLKESVLKDFQEISALYGFSFYPTINPQRADQTYYFNGNEITFLGLDQEQKLFGRKQDLVWVNEAISSPGGIQLTKSHFNQLEMRTNEAILLDYNPKLTSHWIFDSVLTRNDVDYMHSTMLDNPFLPEKIRQKILSYKPTPENIKRGTADETMWKIYGLGEKAEVRGKIFTKVFHAEDFPPPEQYKWHYYGLDFGFTNDPTALIEIAYFDGEIYIRQLIYETGLTNQLISEAMKKKGVKNDTVIIADSSEPKSIQELNNLGWSVRGVVKGADSVNYGIQVMQNYNLNVLKNSLDLLKEFENYKWMEDNAGNSLNKPIDAFNHGIDATRYVFLEKLGGVRKNFAVS